MIVNFSGTTLLAQATDAAGRVWGLDSEQIFWLLMAAIGAVALISFFLVLILPEMYSSIQRHRAEMDLKREMVERGMSADEIIKVIEAAPPLEGGMQRWLASWGKKK